MRTPSIALLLAGFLGTTTSLHAHPGDDHTHEKPANLRIWRDADCIFELEAAFVAARDGRVLLARVDGSEMRLPIDRLSRADQDWIRRRQAEIQAINQIAPAAISGSRIRERPENAATDRFIPLAALGATVTLAALGLILRRRRAAFPLSIAFFLPVCMIFACSARKEAEEDIVAWDDGVPPDLVAAFQPFKDKLKVRWNNDTLFIESNGLPDHPMMIGITNWQQQVPLPQPYTGNNAWQIPLKPKLADNPISAKKALFRGAIALAVNGVPIFNALNNRGEDAFLIGELDEFGGHCGKGDDYHYHAAPLHLEKIVGLGNPIGYALDGFPLYGLTNDKLDEFNGRFDDKGNYRYHSTKTYPYINGGLRGVVTVRNDAVEPQPRAAPMRPPGEPLRGAKITGFTVDEPRTNFSLKYDVRGQTHAINYKVNPNGTVTFAFVDERGGERTETYTRREGKGDKKGDEKKKKGKGPGKSG